MLEPLGGQPIGMQKRSRKGCWIIGFILFMTIVPTIVILAVVFGGLFFGVKSVEEYGCAMTEIRKNKQAIELLGEPMTEGTFVLPNISISGTKRDVQFSVSMTGPKGTGKLMVVSYRDSFRSDFAMMMNKDEKGAMLYSGTYPCQ
jgi:Cytochrome oxidase complex assembly protein 1